MALYGRRDSNVCIAFRSAILGGGGYCVSVNTSPGGAEMKSLDAS